MRRIWLVLAVVAVVAVACGGSNGDEPGATAATGATNTGATGATTATGATATGASGECVDLSSSGSSFTITIEGFAFHPSCFTASASQSITVINLDSADHTFTMIDTEVDVPVPAGEEFNGEPISGVVEPGTYDLVCTIHPSITGQVTVVA